MTKSGCSAWNQLDGNVQPKSQRRVWRSAKRVSVEPDCSNPPQKMTVKTKRMRMTKMRLHSAGVRGVGVAALGRPRSAAGAAAATLTSRLRMLGG
jgi:hypothetical protein